MWQPRYPNSAWIQVTSGPYHPMAFDSWMDEDPLRSVCAQNWTRRKTVRTSIPLRATHRFCGTLGNRLRQIHQPAEYGKNVRSEFISDADLWALRTSFRREIDWNSPVAGVRRPATFTNWGVYFIERLVQSRRPHHRFCPAASPPTSARRCLPDNWRTLWFTATKPRPI